LPLFGQLAAMLVFVLATFCWTKSLICNVAAFTRMLLYPESTLQLCSSRRFCEVLRKFISVPGRCGIPSGRSFVKASSIQTKRTFRPDAHQCLEASNSSRFHPSKRNGKSSGRSSEFEKNPAFKCISPDVVVIPSGYHLVLDKH